MSRTEITASQWLDFVRAYAPYHDNMADPYDPRFKSDWINVTVNGAGQVPSYSVAPVNANKPISVGWDYAARFCNWLTNGERSDRDAFDTGAYDLRNLQTANGHWITLPTRLPTATYWLPSLDEWAKAAFYDPNRYGSGQQGYWAYPDAGNTALVPGWPESGGQTDAGIPFPGPGSNERFNDVASYSSVQSPWGLFDLSGGETEWSDATDGFRDSAFTRGTQRYDDAILVPDRDRIDWGGYGGYGTLGYGGIRLASTVPEPAALLPSVLVGLLARRIRHEGSPGSCGDRTRRQHGTRSVP